METINIVFSAGTCDYTNCIPCIWKDSKLILVWELMSTGLVGE